MSSFYGEGRQNINTDPYKPIVLSNQHEAVFYGLAKAAGDTTQESSDNPVGTYTDEAKASIKNMLEISEGISDVTINSTSIVDENGVAKIPVASGSSHGVVKYAGGNGIDGNDSYIYIVPATSNQIKTGTAGRTPIVPRIQHESTFYGLAKAAGDTTQSSSSNSVGTYTPEASLAIRNMIGATGESSSITVTETEPTINAGSNARYICGELSSLTFTPCSSGLCEVVFSSGTTPTVLNLPQTVVLPEWFEVETNRTYEISILDGVYGAVMVW